MERQTEVTEIIASYKCQFPDDTNKIEEFEKFVSQHDEKELYSRTNFNGHITVSGVILNQERNKILLLKHKQLGRWLLPGGHVEDSDTTILHAVYREIEEETTLSSHQLTNISFEENPMPIEMDSHIIPFNEKKNEQMHYHHDFRFLFIYSGDESSIRFDPNESEHIKWVELMTLEKSDVFSSMLPKIKKLLDRDNSETLL